MGDLKKHIPNALGVLRFLLGLTFPLIPHPYRLTIVLIAAVSDLLDGFLARRWNAESNLGQIIDPVADKTFVAIMAFTFLFEGRVELAQLLLVGARDMIVASGALLLSLSGRSHEILDVPSRALGKTTTTLQILFLISILFTDLALWELALITGAFSIAAGVDYALHYLLHVRLTTEEA